MPFIYIDRRKAGRGKSSGNRQKLLKRIKSYIKISSPKNIGSGGVTNSQQSTSPVKVANSALDEPWFAYASDGERTAVVIGNDQYERGDTIKIPEQQEASGNGNGSGSGNGEDDFVVNVARDEFLDLFFEDCELPNLVNERYTEKLDNKFQPAGFSTTGTPAQLSIIRTYKQALGRRLALAAPHRDEIEQLEQELADKSLADERRLEVEERLAYLRNRVDIINNFDNSDLRYRKREAKPIKTVDAVLVMIMDISGSMTQDKKIIARRWFALLYSFIKRRYSNTELVFIAHTDEAFEMNEGDFFSTKINGATCVSPALQLANKIIKERYDPNQTNIYISHASDGDNMPEDEELVKDELIGSGKLLNAVQFYNYVEVGKSINSWHSMVSKVKANSSVWQSFEDVQDEGAKNLSMSIIEAADDCYSVFKRVFKKKS